jgi:hypothetical protein
LLNLNQGLIGARIAPNLVLNHSKNWNVVQNVQHHLKTNWHESLQVA